nr:hypothetical protein BFBNJELC_00036 [uncultured bacterium]
MALTAAKSGRKTRFTHFFEIKLSTNRSGLKIHRIIQTFLNF